MSNKTLEQKIAVMQHYANGGKITCNGDLWVMEEPPAFAWEVWDYSIYEEPKTLPSINWEHVSSEYNWMATDASGDTYLFINMPTVKEWNWSDGFSAVYVAGFISFTPGTCNWKESLVQRPE